MQGNPESSSVVSLFYNALVNHLDFILYLIAAEVTVTHT